MELKIYSIYDKKTVLYLRPFYSHNRGSAMRSVVDEMRNKDSILALHPHDYALFEIGKFEDRNGVIVPNTPETVCEIAELIEVDNGATGRS